MFTVSWSVSVWRC